MPRFLKIVFAVAVLFAATVAVPQDALAISEQQLRNGYDKITSEIRNIPFVGASIADALAKKLNVGESDEYGTYLEASTGKYGVTVFDAGEGRLVAGLFKSGELNPLGHGALKVLPGAKLINPVIYIRTTRGDDVTIDTSTLPGQLGTIAPKTSAEVKLPKGVVITAQLKTQGAFRRVLKFKGLPVENIFITAGGALLDFSIKGDWVNPLGLFNKKSKVTDFSLTINKKGDVASTGLIKLLGKDFTFLFNMPGILKIGSKPPALAVGLSIDEFTLKDNLRLKLMMAEGMASGKFLKRMSALTDYGMPGGVNDIMGAAASVLDPIRTVLDSALKVLPLDGIKVVNTAYVAYDKNTGEIPPMESFTLAFASPGLKLPDGGVGPMMVANGNLEVMGLNFAQAKARLDFSKGLQVDAGSQIDLALGKILGAEFNIKGSADFIINIGSSGALMSLEQVWDILGIAKGLALMEFKVEGSPPLPKMHVIFDPTSGCAPPIPIKIDATIGVPTSTSNFISQIKGLANGLKFDSGGIAKCAGKLIEWAEDGAKVIAKGAVEIANAAADTAKQIANLSIKGAKLAINSAEKISDGLSSGGISGGANAALGLGKDLVKAVNKYAEDLGCNTGMSKCHLRLENLARISSPFYCRSGFSYNAKTGTCWRTGTASYAFTGANTGAESLCLDLAPKFRDPFTLQPCNGSMGQQFTTLKGSRKRLAAHQKEYGSGSAKDKWVGTLSLYARGSDKVPGKKQILVSGLPGDKNTSISYVKGELVLTANSKKMCIRPDHPILRAGRTERLAAMNAIWVKTAGGALDVSASMDGSVYKIGEAGKISQLQSNHKWKSISGPGFTRLDSGTDGLIWAVKTSSELVSNQGGKWTADKTKKALDVGVGGPHGQTVVIVSKENGSPQAGYMTFIRDPKTKKWTALGRPASRIAMGGDGLAWVIDPSGKVSHQFFKTINKIKTIGGWKAISPLPDGDKAIDIAVSPIGTAMVASSKGRLYSWDEEEWVVMPGGGTSITFDSRAVPWVVMSPGHVDPATYDFTTAAAKKYGPAVYAYKKAKLVKTWKGETQATPLDPLPVWLEGKQLVIAACEEKPVMPTWSTVLPDENKDMASRKDMERSFALESMQNPSATLSNSEIKGNGFQVTAGDGSHAKTASNYFKNRARSFTTSEYSAVFVGNNEFALYNHRSGLCLADGGGSGSTDPARMKTCTFKEKQIWQRLQRKVNGKAVSAFKNAKTNRCVRYQYVRGRQELQYHDILMTADCRKEYTHTNWIVHPLSENPNLDKRKPPKNWTPYGRGFAAPKVSKEGSIVTITGLITGGDSDTLLKLPKAALPSERLVFNSTNSNKPIRIDVLPNGLVEWVAGGRERSGDRSAITLSGISYSVKDGTKLALKSGWVPEGDDWGIPRATKSGDIVTLSGSMKGGTYGLLATLPKGMRPVGRLIFNTNNHTKSARIDVSQDGNIYWAAGAKDHGWLSLSGITFSTKAGTRVPFANGWKNEKGYAALTVSRHGDNVIVTGTIRGTRWDQHVAILPKGFRPPANMLFSVNNHDNSAVVQVSKNGQIKWLTGTLDHGWMSLSGIKFKTDEKPYVEIQKKLPTNKALIFQVEASGKCLDNSGSNKEGAQAHAWSCDGRSANQQYRVKYIGKSGTFTLVNQKSKMCLAIAGGNENGSRVVQWKCFNKNDHLWRAIDLGNGWFSFKNAYTGRCLDLLGFRKPNGSKFGQWDCNGKANQKFKIKELPKSKVLPTNKALTLQVKTGGKCLDKSGSNKEGAQAHAWSCDSRSANQQYRVKYMGKSGTFTLVNQESNMCLAIAGPQNNGAGAVQWPCSNKNDHLWRAIDLGGGWFSFKNAYTRRCLDLLGGKKPNGSKFGQWDCNGNANQQFKIKGLSGFKKSPPDKWHKLPGAAMDIGSGANGTTFVIGSDSNSVYRWNPAKKNWDKFAGGLARIDVDQYGNPVGLNKNLDMYRHDGKKWQKMPGKAHDIGVGANGKIWHIGKNGIYRWDGKWVQIPGKAVKIDVDLNGNAWTVNKSNDIHRFNGKTWQKMPGKAKDIGIGANGSVMIIGTNDSPYVWNGKGWDKIAGKAIHITVNKNGDPWVVTKSNSIYAWDKASQLKPSKIAPPKPPANSNWSRLQVKHSNKCLDVAGVSKSKGGVVHQWDCTKVDNQQWRMENKGGGWFSLRVKHSNKCLDVAAFSKNNRAKIQQWDCINAVNQQWRKIEKPGGWFSLQAKHSNKCLDMGASGKNNGAKFIQWDCHGGPNQLFRLKN